MRKFTTLFVLLFFCLPFFIHSQELVVHELLPPEVEVHNDLHFLNTEIEGKRLIMLGEMTHGYGNIFEMKIRIIEYLHEQLGFSTIAMESPMYDLWLFNKNEKFNSAKFNESIFEVWSNSSEYQRLVEYIKNNNIKVIGFDSQVNNLSKFIDDFFRYCKTKNIEIEHNERDLGIIIEGVLNIVQFENYDISFKDFENEIKNVIAQINDLPNTENNFYWLQFTKGLLSCSRDAYYNNEDILTSDYANEQHNFRDKQMADNLLSYMERYADEKIICWADNIHVINDMSSIKKNTIKDFKPMGSYIKSALGDKVYSLATIHANDSLKENEIWHKTPISKPSFELDLRSFNFPYLFVSSNQKAMRKIRQHRLLSFVEFTEGRLDQLFDGYIFINHATVPKNKINSLKSGKSLIDYNEEEEIRVVHKTVIGEIIDQETGDPIPYANIIIKDAEFYRIADEFGRFNLMIIDKILPSALVEVSSMGYDTKTIPVGQLNSKINLSPSFNELDEVVIRAYASPKIILEKAIKKIPSNHPISPFNSKRYGRVTRNRNDEMIQDSEFVFYEYDQGYRQPFISTRQLKHIKRNIILEESNRSKIISTGSRENALQYSNIVHKRKYSKFDLKFVRSNNLEDSDLYIISFQTNRDKWNYTNRAYPTNYSGKIYISKENFAIIKISQNWETTLSKKEIDKYKAWLGENVLYNNYNVIKIKEESICDYRYLHDSKYYADRIFMRTYIETIDSDDNFENSVYENDALFFDINLDKVEVIDYIKGRQKGADILYNESFWKAFDSNIYKL